MEALKIKKSGWLWKLAKFGGLSDDGLVFDRANDKYNNFLRLKYDAKEITYTQFKEAQRDSLRPMDFCDFTRFVCKGVTSGLCLATLVMIILVGLIAPMFIFLYWGLMCLFGHPIKFEGVEAWGLVLIIFWTVGLLIYLVDKYKAAIRHRFTRRKEPDEVILKRKLQRAESSYNKAVVRKAFFQSMKGKTCFKMEVVE